MPLNMNEIPKAAGTQRALIPVGQNMARFVQVIDLGLQEQRAYLGKEKKPKYEVYVTLEFPDERIELDGVSRPMWKSQRIGMSTDDRSTCYKWYSKLDPEGKFRGDWSQFIDQPCAALITHDKGKGKNEGRVFDNISDVMPLMKGVVVPPLENDPVVFDLGSPDREVFEAFPEWLQNVIKQNLEYDNSKLQRMLEGQDTKFTARTEGDAPPDMDGEPAAGADTSIDDDDEPW